MSSWGFNNMSSTISNLMDDLQRQVLSAEEKRRKDARENIVKDASMDTASRQELLRMFDSGKGTDEILARLNDAKKGVGVFGINQKNAELTKQLIDKPGRQQVILTQGAKAVSGTESTGLLTGIKK